AHARPVVPTVPVVRRLGSQEEQGVRVTTVLKGLLGLCRAVVVCSWELADHGGDGARPTLVVKVRTRVAGGAGAGDAERSRRGSTVATASGPGVTSMSPTPAV